MHFAVKKMTLADQALVYCAENCAILRQFASIEQKTQAILLSDWVVDAKHRIYLLRLQGGEVREADVRFALCVDGALLVLEVADEWHLQLLLKPLYIAPELASRLPEIMRFLPAMFDLGSPALFPFLGGAPFTEVRLLAAQEGASA